MRLLLVLVGMAIYLRVALAAFRSIIAQVEAGYHALETDGADLVFALVFALMWPLGWPLVRLIFGRRDDRGSLLVRFLKDLGRAKR